MKIEGARMRLKIWIILLGIIMFSIHCQKKSENIQSAIQRISEDTFRKHEAVLASDEFMGRLPGTVGEEKTIRYLEEQFRQMGLKPANGESYLQEVPLVRLTADPSMKLKIKKNGKGLSFAYATDFIGGSPQLKEKIDIRNSDIVFVGYGINAPEYNWNDYEGLDVRGKTVLMLVNDPGFASGDSTLFKGKAMTYYGRWTYKYEEAARQGARAAIIIHETAPASYPWSVVRNSWSGPQYYLKDNELARSNLEFQGWITVESARKLFQLAGIPFEKSVESASQRGFKPFDMHTKMIIRFNNRVEHVTSHNVAAILPGKERADEFIIYTAHWDHLGVNPELKPDSILNGAVDNASGTAALLCIADAFTHLPSPPERSVMFLAVTAEEQGLLGSKFYAENPLVPLEKTVANINMDGINIFGKTKDMTIIGYGMSELDKYAEKVLKRNGRYVRPDPTPEKGFYFRSDHFNFAKVGVPAIYLSSGIDNVEHGPEWGLAQKEEWIKTHYHKPSDNYEPDKWDFEGIVSDIRIYFEVGYELCMSDEFPEWAAHSPFRKIRENMFKQEK